MLGVLGQCDALSVHLFCSVRMMMIDELLRLVYTGDFCGDFCGHLRGDCNCCHEIVTISNLLEFKRDLTAIFRWRMIRSLL